MAYEQVGDDGNGADQKNDPKSDDNGEFVVIGSGIEIAQGPQDQGAQNGQDKAYAHEPKEHGQPPEVSIRKAKRAARSAVPHEDRLLNILHIRIGLKQPEILVLSITVGHSGKIITNGTFGLWWPGPGGIPLRHLLWTATKLGKQL